MRPEAKVTFTPTSDPTTGPGSWVGDPTYVTSAPSDVTFSTVSASIIASIVGIPADYGAQNLGASLRVQVSPHTSGAPIGATVGAAITRYVYDTTTGAVSTAGGLSAQLYVNWDAVHDHGEVTGNAPAGKAFDHFEFNTYYYDGTAYHYDPVVYWYPRGHPSGIPASPPWQAECDVAQISIRHGRDDPTSQPEAPAATFDVWGAVPAWVDIGAACEVKATLAGVDYPRFVGTVTDLTVGWDTPTAPVGRIIAVGQQARMGSRIVGSTVFPAETDGARANRCITAAGVPTDGARTDPGTVQVVSRGKDPQDALSIAQDAAADGAGMVWQSKDGVVLYADADHRRDAPAAVALDACSIPIGVEWGRNLQGLVNDVTITAPVEDHYSDPASIAKYGTFSTSLSTRLASRYDAENLALLMLARQSDPAWVLAGLSVDLQLVSAVHAADPATDEAITADLLALDMHDLVAVSGLPAGSPHPSAVLWVEGWTETITGDRWRLDLAVADYCRNASLEIWDDVDAATTWDTAPDVTWDDITCTPPTGVGTWNDVPSRAHWDTVPATITWDTAEDLWPS